MDFYKSSLIAFFNRRIFSSIIFVCIIATQNSIAQSSSTPPNVYSPIISSTYSNLSTLSSQNTTATIDDFTNKDNLIDSDTGNFTSSAPVSTGDVWIEVTDNDAIGGEEYPGGSYIGFVIDNALAEVLSAITITTYDDGISVESISGGSLLLASLGLNQAKIGFVTGNGADFDAVRITFSGSPDLVGVGNINIFYAEILTPSTSDTPDEVCNTDTPLLQADPGTNTDGYPVII